MKISSREKNLLVLLAAVLVAYLFFSFVYTPQSEKIQSLKQSQQDKQVEYEQKQAMISSETSVDSDIASTKKKLFTVAKSYFGNVDQEDIIVILNDFAQKANLDIKSIKFMEPVKTSLSELGVGTTVQQQAEVPANGENTDVSPQDNDNQEQTETSTSDGNGDVSSQDNISQEQAESSTSDNITTRSVDIDFEAGYDNLMDYLIEVGNYEKYISISSMNLNSSDEIPLSGTISMNFYCIDSVDKYAPKELSDLENNVLSLTNQNPFTAYMWAKTVSNSQNSSIPELNNLGIVTNLVDTDYSIPNINPYSVDNKSVETTQNYNAANIGQPSYTKDDIIYDETLLYNFEDDMLNTFSGDNIGKISSMLEENVKSKKKMYSISYSFADGSYGKELYLDLRKKNIMINNRPAYLSLKVNADKRADNILGMIVTDARGMDYRVFLTDKIDWINQKELRGVVLEDKNIKYPLKVKSIFVRENSTTATKGAKLSFSDLRMAYSK
ncbi:hypothetical protein [Peptoanaerobacter stomatis]|uniref:hypothetical protein n=1 Tax=Peptoanaerobacter stomatis TaxID=796937 RepID=UPI003FA01318